MIVTDGYAYVRGNTMTGYYVGYTTVSIANTLYPWLYATATHIGFVMSTIGGNV